MEKIVYVLGAGFSAPLGLQPLTLAKLHGSVHNNTVVPPTWNKTVAPQIREDWQNAFKALSEATQIRFLGYSMPATDSYLKCLLKSAVLECPHLKAVDVICHEVDGSVQRRYDAAVLFDQLEQSHENFMSDPLKTVK